MRMLSYLITFLFSLLLAACGGGGGSPGLGSGAVSTFAVVAPSTLTMQAGLSQRYSIQGGVKPYAAVSTDPAVAVGWVGGDDFVYVGAVVPGKAIVSVLDAKGSKFDMAITSGSSTAFFTTAPSSLTIAPVASAAQTYTLGGGTPPYTAVSSVPRVVGVSVNGSQVTITGNPLGDQSPSATASATVTFRDAAGVTLSTAVTVTTSTLTLSMDKAQAFRGDVVVATITGGTPPYRTETGLPGYVTPRIVNGNRLEVTLEALADPAIVSVFDANNQRASVSITVIEGIAGSVRLSPAALTVSENEVAPILLNTYGVSEAGAPTVFSSDPTLLQASYSNKLITVVTGTRGTRCVDVGGGSATITLVDATGHQGSSTITIKDNNGGPGCSIESAVALFTTAPASLTLAPGSAGTYSIGGGKAPYTATSSNPAVVGVSLSGGTLTINGLASGSAAVVIRDSAGATLSITVTVQTVAALSISAPSAVTIAPGASAAQTYYINGGMQPYSATSSNVSVATVAVSGDRLTVTGVQAGSAQILIRDFAGSTVTLSVTVAAPASIPLSISPSSVTAFINDTVFARISGGTPPYKVDTGVTDALTATIANTNEVTIKLLRAMAGYSFIVLDANNQTATLSLTASAGTNVFRLSPATLTISETEAQDVLLTMYGQAPGTVRVFTSNTTLLGASVSGNVVTLSRRVCVTADTPVTVSAIDSAGSVATSTVTVTNNATAAPACP